jgi:hypothetical protein
MATHTWTPEEEVSRKELFDKGHFHSEYDGTSSWLEVSKLDRDSRIFKRAVSSYQMTAELEEDQEFGRRTVDSLRYRRNSHGHERICDCPDYLTPAQSGHVKGRRYEELNISNGTRTLPSPETPFTFSLRFRSVQGLDEADTLKAWKTALQDWNSTCGVNLVLTDDYDSAHVPTWTERLGGSTLAIALLQTGSRSKHSHWQKYDKRDWSIDYLIGTIIHETGHTMGFSHANSGTSIMRPFMNPNVTRLQQADKTRTQRYYGPPLNLTPDEPTPPDGDEDGLFDVHGTMSIGNRFAVWDGRGKYVEQG